MKVALLTEIGGGRVQIEPSGGRGRRRRQPAAEKIAPEFGYQGYVLTNQQSLLVVRDGGVLTGSSDSTFARECKEMKDVEGVLRYLR